MARPAGTRLAPARRGDHIRAADLQHSVLRLVSLAGDFCGVIDDNTTFTEQRQILRRTHSLLNLSVWLDRAADIGLAPGQPRITAAHVNGAVDYALSAYARIAGLADRLAVIDVLLDFFQAVLSGEGERIVAAAHQLRAASDALSTRAPGTAAAAEAPGTASTDATAAASAAATTTGAIAAGAPGTAFGGATAASTAGDVGAIAAGAAGPGEDGIPAASRPLPNAPLLAPYRLADFHRRDWEVGEYVLLPLRGMRSPELAAVQQAVPEVRNTPKSVALLAKAAALPTVPEQAIVTPQILHSTHDDGAKLAALTQEEVLELKAKAPGVRVLPLVIYETTRRPMLEISPLFKQVKPKAAKLEVKIVRDTDGAPVQGAHVVAFTNFEQRAGAEATSDAGGIASLAIDANRTLDVLLIYGPSGYWGLYKTKIKLRNGTALKLKAVNLKEEDYLARLYGKKPDDAGKGVTVGIIDTGVALDHPDLKVAGGAAFVVAENDAGGPGPAAAEGEHGSHVAGIVSSHGKAPTGKRGVAPGVKLMSYRVFPNAGGGATNYDIIRAIDRGVTDGCDLLNMSLGGAERDEAVREAIKDAFDKGTLCICATGNDGRGPVNYPARWPESVSVSAIGRKGSFPDDSSEAMDVQEPFAPKDKEVFVAGFSNIGPEVDLTGPGVGHVSTVPGGAYAVMSGPSMATPADTGAA
ncbi:MAG TPA: S8 family serine peptidase, partial [Pseudoduganella sp.]